jgi:hypothetical protein
MRKSSVSGYWTRLEKTSDALRARLQENLRSEQRSLGREISTRTQREVFAIVRKTLADLAAAGLEGRMADVFVGRLRKLSGAEKQALISATRTSAGPALLRSAFDLPPRQRLVLDAAVKDTLGPKTELRFETAPDLVSGVELDYLTSLADHVGEVLEKKAEAPNRSLRLRWSEKLQKMPPDSLQSIIDTTFTEISRASDSFTPQLTPREAGTITSTGIAKIAGLPWVGSEELVKFPGDLLGIAFNLDDDEIGVVLLGECWHLHTADEVVLTGRVMDVPVDDGLISRVIDPLSVPLDGKAPIRFSRRLPTERNAPPIMDRGPVTDPFSSTRSYRSDAASAN